MFKEEENHFKVNVNFLKTHSNKIGEEIKLRKQSINSENNEKEFNLFSQLKR